MNADLVLYYRPALGGAERYPVLDFGSGHGRVLSFLVASGFKLAEGYERDKTLEASLIPGAIGRTTFGADWRRFLSGKNNRWAAVILKDVLYYFEDDEASAFLRELKGFLAPGAVLAIEVFNGATLTGPYVMYKDRQIRRVFTEHSLKSLLEEAGFSVERMCGMRIPVTGARSALFAVSSLLWKSVLRAVYWCERGLDSQNPRILDKKIFAVAKAISP